MKILFCIKSMNNEGGGAERILADVANGLSLRGHEVGLVTFDQPNGNSFYTLNNSVLRTDLGVGDSSKEATVSETLKRVATLRARIKRLQPDIAVGFMHSMYIPLGLALVGSGIPVIASEHIVPAHFEHRPLQKMLLALAPHLVDQITCVSNQVKKAFPSRQQRLMTVVPNPLSIEISGQADVGGGKNGRKTLLAVGRLEDQKDHKSLIAAFGRIKEKVPDWDLRLVGNGRLMPDLKRQVEQLGLTAQVQFAGSVQGISNEYRNAQLYVIPSRYESFGLTVIEALAHGLPAVGMEDCQGVNELIIDGQNGKLVSVNGDRISNLAQSLFAFMSDAKHRQAHVAPNFAIPSEHRLDQVIENWECLARNSARHAK